jgi:hypothetical protein
MNIHYCRLKEANLITDYKHCPVCGDNTRREISKAPYHDLYLDIIARELSLSCDETLHLLKVHDCGNCRSIYADPWLSIAGMNRIYAYGRSQHILGWYQFYRWVNEPRNSAFAMQRAGLWRYLSAIAGKTEIYAEANCPFQGLLLHFKDLELDWNDKTNHVAQHIGLIQGEHTNPFNPHGFLNRLYWKISKKFKRKRKGRLYKERHALSNVNRLSMRSIRKAMSYRKFAPDPKELRPAASYETAPMPKHRYLLLESTPSYWGGGCVSMGCSCQSTCIGALDTPVLSFTDVTREDLHFDVLSFFNCLDHFINPVEVLERTLDTANLIFVTVHQSGKEYNYYRQHQFAFDRNFLDSVAKEDWRYADVSDAVRLQGQNCYLISKSLDVKALAARHEQLLAPADLKMDGGY